MTVLCQELYELTQVRSLAQDLVDSKFSINASNDDAADDDRDIEE